MNSKAGKFAIISIMITAAMILSWIMGSRYQAYETSRGAFPIWFALYKSSKNSDGEGRALRAQCREAFRKIENTGTLFRLIYDIRFVDLKTSWIGDISTTDMEFLQSLFVGVREPEIPDVKHFEKIIRSNRIPLNLRL